MNKRMAILKSVTVGAIALVLSGAALGTDISVRVAGANAASDTGAANAQHATLNVDLPSIASSVVTALTGGENPSTTVKHDETSAQTNDKRGKNEKANKANDENDVDEATETETETADQDEANEVSHGQHVGQTATAGTRPGFGCGDANHVHSGPPGRTNPSMPPGCTKNH